MLKRWVYRNGYGIDGNKMGWIKWFENIVMVLCIDGWLNLWMFVWIIEEWGL